MTDQDPRVVLHDVSVTTAAGSDAVLAAVAKAVGAASRRHGVREADLERAIENSISDRRTVQTPAREHGIVGGATGSEGPR